MLTTADAEVPVGWLPSTTFAPPDIFQCDDSRVDSLSAATASPNTKPSRCTPKGLLPPGESNCKAAKPPNVRRLSNSTPSTSASSTSPALSNACAAIKAFRLEVQAVLITYTGPDHSN